VLAGARRVATRIARILAAAEAVGGMHACLDMSVAYAAVREQFGRPIGSFQAIKHHLADMLVDAELAAAATWDATRRVADEAEGDLVAAVAAGCALPAFQRVAERTIQIHGGIGYTWEHDAHLYLRRAAALCALFGPADILRQQITDLRRAGVRRHETVDLPPEAEEKRSAARAFKAECLRTPEDRRQALFARSGFLVPHWPAPYGRAAGPIEQLVIEEELAGLERPSLGLGEWLLPTVLQHGTPAQLERWMWPSLEGDLRWCQLFSEPGAGSDAAAISTRARRVEGGWSVTGQKVWTSDARACQRGLATVRTDPSAGKHAGISVMAIDMQATGVEVRPLVEITGETLFNEVFFEEVFVPDGDVVGEVNAGWRVARAALGNERISIGGGSSSLGADSLLGLLERQRAGDVGFLREVGALLAEGQALRMLNLRQAARAVAGSEPGVEGSLAKAFGAEHAQRVAALGMRIAGAAVLLGEEPTLEHDFFYTKCLTIAGGTSEVLRNQIAERILGLPREPTTQAKSATR
jgi:alkylation response protein AidB-like acyl-CoA dehydrogenase